MEQIIVSILLVLAAIANLAFCIHALEYDEAVEKREQLTAEHWFYFSEISLMVTLVASWLLKEAILAARWGIMWCVLLLASVVFGVVACWSFYLKSKSQKNSSKEE